MNEVESDAVTSAARPVVATAEELAAVRNARGLSQTDISQRIKLQPRQVLAIEEGRWADLPGLSFARGAVRSYAKLVNADVTPLLEAIGGYSQPASTVAAGSLRSGGLGPAAPIGLDSGGRGGHPYLWVAAGLVGVVLLVFFFGTGRDGGGLNAWFPSSGSADQNVATGQAAAPTTVRPGAAGSNSADGGNPVMLGEAALAPLNPPPSPPISASLNPSSGSSAASSPATSSPAASAGAPVTPVPLPTPAAGSPSASPATASPSAPSSGEASSTAPGSMASAPIVAPASPAAASGSQSANPPAGTPASPATAGSDRSPAVAAVAPAPAADVQNAVTAPVQKAADVPVTKGQIVLRAGEESWVEVRQADGKALHLGALAAGGELVLQGQPPYRLTLGNPGKLTLVYEGETRDLAPVTSRTNVARITLN